MAELWNACGDVYDDGEVSAWLAYRGLDPAKVSDLNLARALPPTGSLPAWARCAGRPWSAGWRCIFPIYDATGTLASLRARWCHLLARGEAPAEQLDRPPEDLPAVKSAAAAAGPGSASGLVLADGLLLQLLRTGERPHWWPEKTPLRIVVVEGELRGRAPGCPGVPRTDPSERNYRTGLLPRMLTTRRLSGEGW